MWGQRNARRSQFASIGIANTAIVVQTTFKLGDFYVSPFLFRNVLFKKSPVMPAIIMLHERKLSSTHAEMMRYIASELPCLATGNNTVPKVTDNEKRFEVIDEYLPKIHRLLCWNQTLNSANRWLKSHGASSAEITVYVSNIRTLFHQKTEEKYFHLLDQL